MNDPRTKVWTTASNEALPVQTMSRTHLENTLIYLDKRLREVASISSKYNLNLTQHDLLADWIEVFVSEIRLREDPPSCYLCGSEKPDHNQDDLPDDWRDWNAEQQVFGDRDPDCWV